MRAHRTSVQRARPGNGGTRRAGTLLLIHLAVALTATSLVACSDDDPSGPGAGLAGTWNATSFVVQGQDLIVLGMGITLALNSSNTFVLTVTGDLTGVCGGASSCTENGSYSSTATQITLNPGTEDEVTFNYALLGQTLTLTGSIDGNQATITLIRA